MSFIQKIKNLFWIEYKEPDFSELKKGFGPYRTSAELMEEKNSTIYCLTGIKEKCPVCDQKEYREYSSFWDCRIEHDHKKTYCTPFNRKLIKRRLFAQNDMCLMSGSHWHCKCLKKECKVEWIAVDKKDLSWKEVE